MDSTTDQLRHIKENNPRLFAKMLLQLTPEEQLAIIYDYDIFLRKNQLPPENNPRYWTILAGRG